MSTLTPVFLHAFTTCPFCKRLLQCCVCFTISSRAGIAISKPHVIRTSDPWARFAASARIGVLGVLQAYVAAVLVRDSLYFCLELAPFVYCLEVEFVFQSCKSVLFKSVLG